MLPVMLAARTLDGEDPKIIYMIRVAYGVVQSLVLLVVFYVYIKASGSCQEMNQVVYVPPAAQVRRLFFCFCRLRASWNAVIFDGIIILTIVCCCSLAFR